MRINLTGTGLLTGALFVGLVAATPHAEAASIDDLFGTFGTGLSFEDDNVEWEIDGGGTEGILEVGDRLRGVVIFPTAQPLSQPLDASTNSAIGAIFDITVESKTPAGAGTSNFTFGPSAGATFGNPVPTGTTVAFYEDILDETTPTELYNAGSRANAEALITDGDLIFTLGEEGRAFESWTALNAQDDLNTVSAGSFNNIFGFFNFQQSILSSNLTNLGTTAATGVMGLATGANGSGTVNGGVVTNDDGTPFTGTQYWDATSDAQIGFTATPVPVPGTLGLLGIAFLMMGLVSRRFIKA